jgi:5'-3' exoribonuclease 1
MLKLPLQALKKTQQELYRKIKDFVLSNRKVPASQSRTARLALPNTLPARDRTFITKLAIDLHLLLAWDEYDEEDQNVVTFRFPSAVVDPTVDGGEDGADDGEWEDEDEEADTEANSAVDRVLKKYSKMKVTEDDEEGDFDERYEKKVKDKMDAWKRDYYRVSCQCFPVPLATLNRKLYIGET